MRVELAIIQKTVEDYFGFQINKKSRQRHLVDARRIYFRLAREFTNYGLVRIGKSMDKDHATALFMIRTCKDICKVDKEYRAKYLTLRKKLEVINSKAYRKNIFIAPRRVHPGRFLKLGYGKTKSIREIFNQRG